MAGYEWWLKEPFFKIFDKDEFLIYSGFSTVEQKDDYYHCVLVEEKNFYNKFVVERKQKDFFKHFKLDSLSEELNQKYGKRYGIPFNVN